MGLRALGSGVLGGVLSAPVIWSINHNRSESFVGTRSLAKEMIRAPFEPQNRMLGVDLVDLLRPFSSANEWMLHPQYLGVIFSGLVLVGIVSLKKGGHLSKTLPLLVSASITLILGFGLYLQVGGEIPLLSGHVILLPAGWLSLLVEQIGRAPRWYRIMSLAVILWAPFAAFGAISVAAVFRAKYQIHVLLLVSALLLLDALWCGPNQWPRDTFDAELPARNKLIHNTTPKANGAPPIISKGMNHTRLIGSASTH